MFAIVGVTLDDVMANSLPQVRLADALKVRPLGNEKSIVVYSNDPTDTQGPIIRAKYKDRGVFLTVLYFSEAAVQACNELRILLRILDYVDEGGLPARKVIAFKHPSVTLASNNQFCQQ